MRPTCVWVVDGRGKLCSQPASHRVTVEIPICVKNRSDLSKPRVLTNHYCSAHASRVPDFDYETISQKKKFLTKREVGE